MIYILCKVKNKPSPIVLIIKYGHGYGTEQYILWHDLGYNKVLSCVNKFKDDQIDFKFFFMTLFEVQTKLTVVWDISDHSAISIWS